MRFPPWRRGPPHSHTGLPTWASWTRILAQHRDASAKSGARAVVWREADEKVKRRRVLAPTLSRIDVKKCCIAQKSPSTMHTPSPETQIYSQRSASRKEFLTPPGTEPALKDGSGWCPRDRLSSSSSLLSPPHVFRRAMQTHTGRQNVRFLLHLWIGPSNTCRLLGSS